MKHVILIPTYNEAENIEKIVLLIVRMYPGVYIKVIDDNSPDGTGQIVTSLAQRFPQVSLFSRRGKEGLGKAYIAGFREVMKDTGVTHIIMMDADMSHDPRYLANMIKHSATYDMVTGSRYIQGGATEGWEMWRKALSFFGNVYARIITRMSTHDLTAGFNCISIDYLKKINLNTIDSSGYAFQIELKYLLYKSGARLKEIPIVFVNRTGGESKISNHIVREGLFAPWKLILINSKISQSVTCSLCGNKSAGYFTRKNNCTLYKCDTCGFLFVYPIPDSSQVYDKSYFSGAEDGFGYVDYDTDKEPMVPTFEKYLDMVEALGKTSGKLLDVGSATGFFMNLAKKRGFDCVGIELSDFAAEKGRSKGLNIVTGDLEGAKFPDQMFDVITMCDVLEHVTNPKSFLLGAKRILKKDGLLVVNTPNAGSLVAKIFGTKWHLIVPPEHLHYFSVKNLSNFLTLHGFSIQVSTTIGKRFTLQYIFKTLYKWQKFSFWNWCSTFFSKGFLSKMYIPLNTHDNLFVIFKKK